MTNTELADAHYAGFLERLADQFGIGRQGEQVRLSEKGRAKLRKAAQRLREMPEGERIEVWATREHDAWVLNENRPHAIARPATLILHDRKEGESR